MESNFIQKTKHKSFFLRMHSTSELANSIFDNKEYKGEGIEILQVLVVNDHKYNYVLELIYTKDNQ
jgi:hypothetical protein